MSGGRGSWRNQFRWVGGRHPETASFVSFTVPCCSGKIQFHRSSGRIWDCKRAWTFEKHDRRAGSFFKAHTKSGPETDVAARPDSGCVSAYRRAPVERGFIRPRKKEGSYGWADDCLPDSEIVD